MIACAGDGHNSSSTSAVLFHRRHAFHHHCLPASPRRCPSHRIAASSRQPDPSGHATWPGRLLAGRTCGPGMGVPSVSSTIACWWPARWTAPAAASSSEPISVAAPSLAVRHGLHSAPGIISIFTVPPDRVTVPPAGNPRSYVLSPGRKFYAGTGLHRQGRDMPAERDSAGRPLFRRGRACQWPCAGSPPGAGNPRSSGVLPARRSCRTSCRRRYGCSLRLSGAVTCRS
jgi:hypothetical protein